MDFQSHPLRPFCSAMAHLSGRHAGQLALFDVSGFTDSSAYMSHAQVRLGPSGEPWIGRDEMDAVNDRLYGANAGSA